MSGVVLSRRKYGDLEKFTSEAKTKLSARILNPMADQFADYVKRSKLSGQVLGTRSGRTRESMGFYQLKRGKGPAYVVRPGRGINGRLNYVGGMSRGMLLSPKKGDWLYIRDEEGRITARVRSAIVRPRPFMVPGWKEFKAGGNVRGIMRGVYAAYLEKAFGGSPVESSI